ncbi:MAG TPA: DUF72 domain-containing protein [Candidatus Acidoferrum sp.]|nr:DUF72 domain-containing protein [Candidatus Acidoferrum sp.]
MGRCGLVDARGNVKIGVAGWSYKDWQGIVYPASLKASARVEYLAQFFDLIEINTSFYGHIKPAVGKEWCRVAASANPHFVFTAKLNRAFTHSPVAVLEPTSAKTIRPAASDEQDAKAGYDSIAAESMLGALLAQFPISFKCTDENRAYVQELAETFRSYPLVLEIRHASWNEPEVLAWIQGLQVGICNIDQPLLGCAVRPSAHVTSVVGYIRLHGRNYKQWFAETNVRDRYDYLYSAEELAKWKDRALEVAGKAETTYVVANNHNFGKAAVNALELVAMIEARKVKAPPTLVSHYPELKQLTSE